MTANFLRSALNARLAPQETNGSGSMPRKGIAPREFSALLSETGRSGEAEPLRREAAELRAAPPVTAARTP